MPTVVFYEKDVYDSGLKLPTNKQLNEFNVLRNDLKTIAKIDPTRGLTKTEYETSVKILDEIKTILKDLVEFLSGPDDAYLDSKCFDDTIEDMKDYLSLLSEGRKTRLYSKTQFFDDLSGLIVGGVEALGLDSGHVILQKSLTYGTTVTGGDVDKADKCVAIED